MQTGLDSSFRPLNYKISANTIYSDGVDGLSYSSRERIIVAIIGTYINLAESILIRSTSISNSYIIVYDKIR